MSSTSQQDPWEQWNELLRDGAVGFKQECTPGALADEFGAVDDQTRDLLNDAVLVAFRNGRNRISLEDMRRAARSEGGGRHD